MWLAIVIDISVIALVAPWFVPTSGSGFSWTVRTISYFGFGAAVTLVAWLVYFLHLAWSLIQ